MDWDALLAKKVKPPFLPVIRAPKDVSNFDEEFTRLKPVLTLPRTTCILTAEQQDIFADFDFSFIRWPKWFTLCAATSLWQEAPVTPTCAVKLIQLNRADGLQSCIFPQTSTFPDAPPVYCNTLQCPSDMQLSSKVSLSHLMTLTLAGSDFKMQHLLFSKFFCPSQIDFGLFDVDFLLSGRKIKGLNIHCCTLWNMSPVPWVVFFLQMDILPMMFQTSALPSQSKVRHCKYLWS